VADVLTLGFQTCEAEKAANSVRMGALIANGRGKSIRTRFRPIRTHHSAGWKATPPRSSGMADDTPKICFQQMPGADDRLIAAFVYLVQLAESKENGNGKNRPVRPSLV
jgi:hypothetical protein